MGDSAHALQITQNMGNRTTNVVHLFVFSNVKYMLASLIVFLQEKGGLYDRKSNVLLRTHHVCPLPLTEVSSSTWCNHRFVANVR